MKISENQMTSRLILPLPPTLNNAYRNVAVNRRIKTPAATQFLHEAGWATKVWMNQTKWNPPDKKAKVIVNMWIFWPDRRKRDADNTMKLLMDSMKGIAFEDDSQVLPRVMNFDVDKRNPRIEVELSVMEAI